MRVRSLFTHWGWTVSKRRDIPLDLFQLQIPPWPVLPASNVAFEGRWRMWLFLPYIASSIYNRLRIILVSLPIDEILFLLSVISINIFSVNYPLHFWHTNVPLIFQLVRMDLCDSFSCDSVVLEKSTLRLSLSLSLSLSLDNRVFNHVLHATCICTDTVDTTQHWHQLAVQVPRTYIQYTVYIHTHEGHGLYISGSDNCEA